MKRLVAELKRRPIYRFGVIYLAIAWLLTQVTVSVEEPLSLPAWMDTVVITLLALGFPVVLLFAWMREPAVRGSDGSDQAATAETTPGTRARDTGHVRGEVRFCTTPSGYRLAYS